MKKVLSDRSLENTQEFGRATQASRLIQTAFYPQIKSIKDNNMYNRLTSRLMQVLQSDPVHDRGQRTVEAGDLSLLEGFDFCIKKQFRRSIHEPCAVTVDRKAGIATVKVPSFIPLEQIECRAKFTHITLECVVVELDLAKDRFGYYFVQSEALPHDALAAVELEVSFPVKSSLPLLVGMGIRVHQQVNGKLYPLRESGALAFQLIKTDAPTIEHIDHALRRNKKKSTLSQVSTAASLPAVETPVKPSRKVKKTSGSKVSSRRSSQHFFGPEVTALIEASKTRRKTSATSRRKKAAPKDTV